MVLVYRVVWGVVKRVRAVFRLGSLNKLNKAADSV